MNIIVLIKQVPDTSEVKINRETNTLIRDGVPSIINPFDMYAIEEALRLREQHGGRVTAVTMGPPQAAEALKEAVALGVDDVVPDISDPGPAGVNLPHGPLAVRFEHVHYAYLPGAEVLSEIDFEVPAGARVAVVGETGGGKTTLAKLLTRLMDPTKGRVLLAGVPLTRVRFASLRRRVVMVPQDGFLFNASVADNVRFGRQGGTPPGDEELRRVFAELDLADWLRTLPQELATPVGERGEALSVGERQLVALARAYLADPDLLVLDEATSAVDPATELRLQRALDAVTRGRTTVTIAHRLSTARSADEVIVVDQGRVVQRGRHADLVRDADSGYARLYASWLEQTR